MATKKREKETPEQRAARQEAPEQKAARQAAGVSGPNPFGFGEKAPQSPNLSWEELPQQREYRLAQQELATLRYDNQLKELKNQSSLLDQFKPRQELERGQKELERGQKEFALQKQAQDLARQESIFGQKQEQAEFLEKNKQTAFNPDEFKLAYAGFLEEHNGNQAKAMDAALKYTVSRGASFGDNKPGSGLSDDGPLGRPKKLANEGSPPMMDLIKTQPKEVSDLFKPAGKQTTGSLLGSLGNAASAVFGPSGMYARANDPVTASARAARDKINSHQYQARGAGSLLNPGNAVAAEQEQQQAPAPDDDYAEEPWAPSAPPMPGGVTIPTRNRPAANLMDSWQNKREANRFTRMGTRYGSSLMRYGR